MDANKLLELSLDFICTIDYKGLFTFVNPTCIELFGYTQDEVVCKEFFNLVHPEDREKTKIEFTKLLEEKETIAFENRVIHKEGSVKHISWKATLVSTEKSIYAIGRDITERKKAELKLHQSNQLLEASQSIAKVGGWELDISTNELFWTAETYRIHDTSPEEFNPTVDAGVSYFLPESRKTISEALKLAIEKGKGYNLELETYTTKGRHIYVRTTCEVTKIDGKPAKLTGIFQDITAQKHSENEIKEHAQHIQAILNSVVASIAVLDGQGNVLSVNNEWVKFAKENGNQKCLPLKDCNYFEVCKSDPNDTNALNVYNGLQQLLNGEIELFELEYPCNSPDKERWFIMRAVMLKSDKKQIVISHINISERKFIENQLIASEEKFKNLAETAQVSISIVAPSLEKGTLYVNNFWEHLTEYSKEESKQLGSVDVVHPDHRKMVLERATKRLQGDEVPKFYELKLLTKSGKTKWVKLSAVPIVYEGVPASLTTFVDITEQKLIREDLIENQIRYQQAQKMGHIGNWEYHTATDTFWGSDEAKRIYGFPTDSNEFTTETVENCIPDRENVHKALIDLIENDKKYDLIFDIITHDKGQKRTIHSIAETVKDQNNTVIKVMGVISDITQLKKSQDAVEKANRELKIHNFRLESLTNILKNTFETQAELLDYTLHQAIKITESKIGYIYFYNDQTKQFTLNTWSGEVMKECAVVDPQTVYDLDSTGCWGEAVRLRKPFMINDYTQPNEYKKGIPTGHVKLKNFLTIPVIVENEIKAVVGVANKQNDYNETDIKQLTLLMDAVWKIVERTQHQKDLLHAKEKAEESDRLKSAFLANMSHEIRTPLNAVLGFSELLARKQLNNSEQERFSDYIRINGESLAKIIDDIIDISKLELKQLSISETSFNITILLKELYDYYCSILVQKTKTQIKLVLDLPEVLKTDFYIKSDEQRLKQILNNLISNAIKYTEKGQITFGCKIEKNKLHFFVNDTGFGIAPENLAQIFKRFVQFSPEYVSRQEGTGLGLSICKDLVSLLGGELQVESKENEGSKFFFEIPFIKAKQPKIKKSDINVQLNKDLSKYRILIADDEDSNYILTKRILKPSKVITDWAQNGKHAVEMATNTKYDLILMDIKMPEMDGIEASRLIKKQNKDIPIIIQTAFAMKEIKDETLKAGCDGFIVKPISLDRFLELVNQHLTK